jgi:anti-sigma B factor antagonist
MVAAPIALSGDVDADTVDELRLLVYDAIRAQPGETVVVDLRGLTFIDSTGLGMLCGALKRARLAEGDLLFTRPSERLWRIFTITGLDKALPFEPLEAGA